MKLSKPVWITLIGSILIVLYLFLFAGPKKTTVSQVPQVKEERNIIQIHEQQKDKVQEEIKKVSRVDATWKKDPFLLPKTHPVEVEKKEGVLRLCGIIEGSEGRYAIIDSSIVKIGDFIGDDKVIEIGEDRVVLMRKGKKRSIIMTDIPKETGSKVSSLEEKK